MKRNTIGKLVALTAAVSMVLAGCGSSSSTTASAATQASAEETTEAAQAATEETAEAASTETAEQTDADLSGSLSMAGSTSMEKVANALAESFMAKYPNTTVTAEFTGSSTGVEAVLAGNVDIGNSSRSLTDDEKSQGAVENIIAIDGIAVITDPANTASDLSKEDLVAIYKGEKTNWSEFGGPDEPIVVIGREAGSGTRGAFEELLEIEDQAAYASELDSTGAVIARVASTPGAIGYASLDEVDDTVKALSIDGVEANEENIKAGSYVLSRPFVMATNGEISEQSELVQGFFAYLSSEEGQEVIKGVGLILPD
ncbi:MAG: phosphate ABC transporter substrate-binding protein [Eubacteriales bacterium]|nr:phosphate ABC transporter substrate-binding protein [Eubacteriales bacterium]